MNNFFVRFLELGVGLYQLGLLILITTGAPKLVNSDLLVSMFSHQQITITNFGAPVLITVTARMCSMIITCSCLMTITRKSKIMVIIQQMIINKYNFLAVNGVISGP